MQGKSGKELWLFTNNYPTGDMENSVGVEIEVFVRHFERVVVFPLFVEKEVRTLPAGAVIRPTVADPFRTASPLTVLLNWRTWITVLREVRSSAPSSAVYREKRRMIWSRMRQALHRVLVLREAAGDDYDPERVHLHSNWALDWATVLGMWKVMDPRVRFTTRMRGFDLYDHRVDHNWQVFQRFHMREADHMHIVSRAGRDHIVERYPEHAHKVSVFHTGTIDHGVGPWTSSNTFRIVSCSNLIPLKRVHLIAEALRHAPMPVHWIHFGDGTERARITDILKDRPAHVMVELRGAVPNETVLAHYAHHPVDLFLHMSSTEGGVAVALQEAASFGIPLMAADSGGVGELVNPATGELLPHDVDAALLLKRMTDFHARGHDARYREGVRAWWKEHFQAHAVYGRLAAALGGTERPSA